MKKIMSILIIFILIISITNNIFATSTSLSDIMADGKAWTTDGAKDAKNGTIDTDTINTASSNIFNALMVIAIVAAVVIGAILGIRIMTAGIDRKVEAKEALVPYLISCVVTFGALGIWKICVLILGSL